MSSHDAGLLQYQYCIWVVCGHRVVWVVGDPDDSEVVAQACDLDAGKQCRLVDEHVDY